MVQMYSNFAEDTLCVDMSAHLWCEVVLLQLPSLSQIPGADSVIQASGPQLGPVIGNVNTACTIRVALELSAGYTHTHTYSELEKTGKTQNKYTLGIRVPEQWLCAIDFWMWGV